MKNFHILAKNLRFSQSIKFLLSAVAFVAIFSTFIACTAEHQPETLQGLDINDVPKPIPDTSKPPQPPKNN